MIGVQLIFAAFVICVESSFPEDIFMWAPQYRIDVTYTLFVIIAKDRTWYQP